MRRNARWAVFLDRDGTLVPDVGWPRFPHQLRLYPGAGAALRSLRGAGALLIVVSNQSVVARGLLDRDGLARMDARLRQICRKAGVTLDAIYNCTHHPDWNGSCSCRKPKPGLLRQGLREFGLGPSQCFMVGDHASDLEAGRRAGMRTVQVLTGHGRRHREDILRRRLADRITRDMTGAARWILESRGSTHVKDS